MTGIPASIAWEMGSVNGCASLGLIMMRSTLALTNSSTWARCWSVSFWASLKTTSSSGNLAAAARMSAFICTRQGSPRLHCDMPITNWWLATTFVEVVIEVLEPPDLPQPLNRAVAKTMAANVVMGAYFVCIIIIFGFVDSQVRLRRWANTAATMITDRKSTRLNS